LRAGCAGKLDSFVGAEGVDDVNIVGNKLRGSDAAELKLKMTTDIGIAGLGTCGRGQHDAG
jgi:hypothetical protein